MKTIHTARLLLSGVATMALMGQANALEAQTFVDRVAKVYKTVGYELSFGEASLDGDTITVDGVTLGLGPEAVTGPVTFEVEITFSGVKEGADGSYTAASVSIPDIDTEFASASEPVGHLTLSDVRAEGLYLPAGETIPAVSLLQLVQSISTGPFSVTRDGVELISIESMGTSSTFNPAQGSSDLADLRSILSINGIRIDLSTVGEEDAEAGAMIEAMGLTTISGDITQDLTWSMADGHVVLNEFLFDFADVGSLNLTADLTGLTPTVLDQIYAMQAGMGVGGEMTEEQSQAQMMQGMALMQGVSIVGASVRYDDASFVDRLIDYYVAQSYADRPTLVEGFKSVFPAMVTMSGFPHLNAIVVPPVFAFLDDPQSLEVKVAPPSPTSLLVLMAAASDPAGLITALGLAVEANTVVE